MKNKIFYFSVNLLLQIANAQYRLAVIFDEGLEDRPYPQARRLRKALTAALSVRAADVPTAGLEGRQIGEKIREVRLAAISDALSPAD